MSIFIITPAKVVYSFRRFRLSVCDSVSLTSRFFDQLYLCSHSSETFYNWYEGTFDSESKDDAFMIISYRGGRDLIIKGQCSKSLGFRSKFFHIRVDPYCKTKIFLKELPPLKVYPLPLINVKFIILKYEMKLNHNFYFICVYYLIKTTWKHLH